MGIMELGAIGELVSGIAVVASLIFVGLQVRQNTATTRAASHHAITDSFNEGNWLLARDPTLSELYLRGHEGRDQLNAVEWWQYSCVPGFRAYVESFFPDSATGAEGA